MILFYGLFMILVVVGLGTIHSCMKIQIKNEERIIERLDVIIHQLNRDKELDH